MCGEELRARAGRIVDLDRGPAGVEMRPREGDRRTLRRERKRGVDRGERSIEVAGGGAGTRQRDLARVRRLERDDPAVGLHHAGVIAGFRERIGEAGERAAIALVERQRVVVRSHRIGIAALGDGLIALQSREQHLVGGRLRVRLQRDDRSRAQGSLLGVRLQQIVIARGVDHRIVQLVVGGLDGLLGGTHVGQHRRRVAVERKLPGRQHRIELLLLRAHQRRRPALLRRDDIGVELRTRQDVICVDRAHDTIRVDHDRRRIVRYAVVTCEIRAARGCDLRVRDALRSRERAHDRRGLGGIDAQEGYALGTHRVCLGDQIRRLEPAGRTPGAPDVDHERPAVEALQTQRLSVEGPQGKGRRGPARCRRRSGGADGRRAQDGGGDERGPKREGHHRSGTAGRRSWLRSRS